MNGKPVTFTVTEIEGIEQIISAGHKWLDGSNPAYPNLILKIGRAFLEAQGEGKQQELYLSEMEAWYLREIVPTNMRVRGEATGLAIKRKLYPVLLDFEAEKYSSLAGIVGNQQKWDTFVKERSGGNGSVVGLPEQVVVAFAAG